MLSGLLLAVILLVSTACSSTPPSSSPRILSLLAENGCCAAPEKSVRLQCTAVDADGDSLSYRWTSNGGSFSGRGAAPAWRAPSSYGEYLLNVEVTDDRGGTASGSLTVTVKENTPPVFDEIVVDTIDVMVGESTEITCIARDADGDELSYYWSAQCGEIFGSGATVVWTAPGVFASCRIEVRVQDCCGAEASGFIKMQAVTATSGTPHR